MASKGKCCRQRPISPNTDHWCRRVYKRVGSLRQLVCLTLPESSVNFVRSQDLLQFIQQWNGSVSLEEVIRIILHVGDIAGCYDELDHDDCLDGVAWALKMMPPGITLRTGHGEQLTGTRLTDSVVTISLLDPTSPQTGPELS